jgi:pyruvate,orthophosphate dikinase
MFLGERRQLVERLILADGEEGRRSALDALEPLQRGDFVQILRAMDGLPVTIRLIDPPLHEFLPDLTDISVKVALAGDNASEKDRKLLEAVRRLHEQNPMLRAGSGSAWSSRGCSPCRCGPSRTPRRS